MRTSAPPTGIKKPAGGDAGGLGCAIRDVDYCSDRRAQDPPASQIRIVRIRVHIDHVAGVNAALSI